jgi:RHH-type proline utilization regulon transcriptional repressor/proline dehydrogenase/delta 1-pyrroline-5-carboxylate dehydrogenase
METDAPPRPPLPRPEADVSSVGTELAARFPKPSKAPAAVLERRMMRRLVDDPPLRAALFRFVDVRPACTTQAEVVRHLAELLADADDSATARRARTLVTHAKRPAAIAAANGVKHMAHRFIVGEDARDALPTIERLWRDGVATTVDLLGEATVTEAEADRYMQRCEDVLRVLGEHADLSVKVSALTPQLRANAPARGADGARERLRHLLRVARDLGAHLHVDMESFDTREAVTRLTLELLSEPEFAAGPSAGIVLQAYLVDSGEHLDALLDWAREHPRAHPLTIRLVKGAYWDHEVVQAVQHGWTPPVFTDRRETDRQFELLTRRLFDAVPLVRPAIASHNLRSVAHAAAYADTLAIEAYEFQVLRGLGDDMQAALRGTGRPVRTYCPVGDLVAGMAYLVRRLLENTSNDSFLAAHAAGADLTTLLEAP